MNTSSCEVGDLSGRHGHLDISAAPYQQSYYFVDSYLPLRGPVDIVNRYVTKCFIFVLSTLSLIPVAGNRGKYENGFGQTCVS